MSHKRSSFFLFFSVLEKAVVEVKPLDGLSLSEKSKRENLSNQNTQTTLYLNVKSKSFIYAYACVFCGYF